MKTTVIASTVVAAALISTSLLSQQEPGALAFPAPSPAATINQRVGLTDIEIKYSRPSAKGRVIFGGLVHAALTSVSVVVQADPQGTADPPGNLTVQCTMCIPGVPDAEVGCP